MSILVSFFCLFMTCTATPPVIHHIPPTSFTIEHVDAISRPKLGAVLTKVPDVAQSFDKYFYTADFNDPRGFIVHMEISKEQYDSGKPVAHDGLVWVSNTRRVLMKKDKIILNDGEYAEVQGTPMFVKSTSTNEMVWMPKAYRVKQTGKPEILVNNLP